MTKIDVLNREGSASGEIELSNAIFMNQINTPIMHQAVRVYLASLRRGTGSVKSRGEVAGGGKKPWRQKGTGRASFGSSRNPVWRGGGVAFGPTPRDYSITMPRKMRRAALLSALSAKLAAGELIIIDELDFEAPKTQEMARILSNLGVENALVILGDEALNTALSLRNLPGIQAVPIDGLNTYNVLYHKKLIITKEALALIEEVYG
jgi:large subunit ribosomal protein L4